MSDQKPALHYVSTFDEARALIEKPDRFWVINCGCREQNGPCKQSRTDICLEFSGGPVNWGSNKHEISRAEVEEIFREAKEKTLVARPFRDRNDMTRTDGVCFCCECCCDYFVKKDEHRSDKGTFIETTDKDLCENCGTCEEVCYFGARVFDGEVLEMNRDECCGCGLCVEVCPDEAIEMIRRG